MKTTLFEGSRINVPERSRSANLNWPFSGSFPDPRRMARRMAPLVFSGALSGGR